MNAFRLVLSSARFYWRTHLGVVIGAALGAMVLTGSLLVGDAVKATLREQALARVGKADAAMSGADRFFQSNLAQKVSDDAAAIVLVNGSVSRADGTGRVNQAQVAGVDDRFWKLAPGKAEPLAPGELALNERLAAQLRVQAGDTLIIRVEKPGLFSRDAPLSGEENEVVALRMKVARVVGDEGYGRFALNAGQTPPFTAFVPLDFLQQRLGLAGRANLLLAPALAAGKDSAKDSTLSELQSKVTAAFTPTDAVLEILKLQTGGVELRSARVFLDPPIVAAAPAAKDGSRIEALTYFVNELRAGDHSTPYSMATAVNTAATGFLPADLANNEMVISQWLADDLAVAAGGEVTLKYFVMGERRQLDEKSRKFTVRSVLPMIEPQLNTSWMPEFPGLSDKKNCRDWKPGFDFDSKRMRDKDQQYWEQYRGTPKAFVNLKVGRDMWSNRWGNTTAIRWPAVSDPAEIETALRKNLTPAQLGFQFIPLREQALAATDAPVDFGQYFVYFSFFLIVAAAVLTGMLFVFSLEQRNAEAGLLLALGLRARQVRRIFLAEGAVLALAGSVLGVIAGALYTKAVLLALSTVWRGAVGSVKFVFVVSPVTMLTGIFSGLFVAWLAMWLASRRQLKHSARELMSGEFSELPAKTRKRRFFGPATLAIVCLTAALAMPLLSKDAETFFCAGALLLTAGLAFSLWRLRILAAAATSGLESIYQLGFRNASRRRGRSLATAGVLASGVFMVVAVDAFRHGPVGNTTSRSSGTGGFALIGESSLPIYDDLNTAKGRETFALDEEIMKGVSVVPMRVHDGDEASCLNLNLALQPRLLGVKLDDMESRHAFEPEAPASDAKQATKGLWSSLSEPAAGGAIPAIVDSTTLEYSLKKNVGDTIDYQDDRGATFKVRLAATVSGSILQGSVIIDERQFIEKFPSQGGYRFFLIDCPPEKIEAVRAELSRALADRGMQVTPTATRLAEFQAVENTYLSIFQALGGLGLLLGSAGLAVVVARNVLERRREFGLLEAVGFRPRQLRRLVFAEHGWLIACGLGIGAASALVAVWPSLRERAGGFPYEEMALLMAGLIVGCVFWVWLASRVALGGRGLFAALRSE
jgi:putative ABC transport system permease protein